jgi:ABC-type transporter Mla subunit MlaD
LSTDRLNAYRPSVLRGSVTGMAALPDPAALDTVARHLSGHADDLRGRASRLVAAAETVRWHSPAAATFRGDVRDLALAFRRAAGEIDDAADALARHAGAVRQVEAPLRAVQHAAGAALHTVEHLLGI